MESQFWQARWRAGQIGFHQTVVEPKLPELFPTLGLPAGASVFVPLCGKSLDLLWLAAQGFRVTGVELSGIAVEAFCLENGIPARRSSGGGFESFITDHLTLHQGDFFALDRERLGRVAAVYDRASLIAWPPELRQRYVEHMTHLTGPGTKTLLITLEYPEHEIKGPPFSLPEGGVRELYEKDYWIGRLSRDDVLSSDARMRARGVTRLHQVCYLLERL